MCGYVLEFYCTGVRFFDLFLIGNRRVFHFVTVQAIRHRCTGTSAFLLFSCNGMQEYCLIKILLFDFLFF
jgi:hypothetical protein